VIRTGLPPGYHDLDTRLLHGVMEEVRRFVATADLVAWDEGPDHAEAWRTLTEAAEWWRGYKARPGAGEGPEEEERWEREADEWLAAIMRVRRHIW
jgi:hypothetical protein